MTRTIDDSALDCIRFYMGDPEIIRRSEFRGGPNAHNTINALLNRGIQNELDKLHEGRTIEIYDRAHLVQYLNIIAAIDRAMRCTDSPSVQTVTWRVDRYSAVRTLAEQGETEGFYSTCKRGFLPEYAHTKADVALIEIVRAPEVPCLDFELLFGSDYAKPEEAEILLPFGAVVQKTEDLPLSPAELEQFTDLHGQPPKGKYRLHLGATPCETVCASPDTLWRKITSEDTVQQVRHCLALLRDTGTLPSEELAYYCSWKDNIRRYFQQIRQKD
jgi:hypothetical protein